MAMPMRFSDRMGITTPPSQTQKDSISQELRYSLWNFLDAAIPYNYWHDILVQLVTNYWRGPADEVPEHNDRCRQFVRQAIVNPKTWYECYNVLEEIIRVAKRKPAMLLMGNRISVDALNLVLERELAPVRFIAGQFVPITSAEEVRSVSEAVQGAGTDEFAEARAHLIDALKKLGAKPTPDYRNSIKESISAVESVCKKITGEESGGLEKSLSKLSASTRMHPRLTAAFKALYDYTSDEDGVRHAMLEDPKVGFAEAQFMLVACSAFMNFVIEKTMKFAETIGQSA